MVTSIKNVFRYVEVMTKITSVFPFMLTLAVLAYWGYSLNVELTSVFFGGMILFDLATTAINNYIDSKANGQQFGLSRLVMFEIIILLLLTSSALGVYLAYKTDLVILIVGIMCFIFGVLYTAGPVPISRQPLGEIVSGLFYGLVIPFIIMYINTPNGAFIGYTLQYPITTVTVNIDTFIALVLFSIPPTLATANIMLANNICDVEKDILVKRFTLPYYIGNKAALLLFRWLYYVSYASIVVMVTLGYFPIVSLLSLLTFPIVYKNLATFDKEQIKEKTFVISVSSFLLVVAPNILLLFVGTLIKSV